MSFFLWTRAKVGELFSGIRTIVPLPSITYALSTDIADLVFIECSIHRRGTLLLGCFTHRCVRLCFEHVFNGQPGPVCLIADKAGAGLPAGANKISHTCWCINVVPIDSLLTAAIPLTVQRKSPRGVFVFFFLCVFIYCI